MHIQRWRAHFQPAIRTVRAHAVARLVEATATFAGIDSAATVLAPACVVSSTRRTLVDIPRGARGVPVVLDAMGGTTLPDPARGGPWREHAVVDFTASGAAHQGAG